MKRRVIVGGSRSLQRYCPRTRHPQPGNARRDRRPSRDTGALSAYRRSDANTCRLRVFLTGHKSHPYRRPLPTTLGKIQQTTSTTLKRLETVTQPCQNYQTAACQALRCRWSESADLLVGEQSWRTQPANHPVAPHHMRALEAVMTTPRQPKYAP